MLNGTDTIGDNIIISLDCAVIGTGSAGGVGFRKEAGNGNSGWDVNWMRSTGVATMARPYAGQNNYPAAGEFMYDQTYNITVVVTGATAAVYHNGTHMVDMDVSANATGGGAISLNAYAAEVLYDNLTVYAIGTGEATQPPTVDDNTGDNPGDNPGDNTGDNTGNNQSDNHNANTADALTGGIVFAVAALAVGFVSTKKRFVKF